MANFRISGQSPMKESCYNSSTSHDMGMKLGPVTKIDKRNKSTSKKLDDDVMLVTCEVIDIFPIYCKF